MAKLKAHGTELDRREYPTFRVAVMSDGHIMRNDHDSWHRWKRVKQGISPQEYADKARAAYNARPPEFHAYMRELGTVVPLRLRARLHTAVSLMPGDPDGVWSEMDDRFMGSTVSVEDCELLCRLYTRMIEASKAETSTEASRMQEAS